MQISRREPAASILSQYLLYEVGAQERLLVIHGAALEVVDPTGHDDVRVRLVSLQVLAGRGEQHRAAQRRRVDRCGDRSHPLQLLGEPHGVRRLHTCHVLPASEIDLGLSLAVFAGSGGKYLLHRIG